MKHQRLLAFTILALWLPALPALALTTPAKPPFEAVLSPLYKSCMAETGGHTDIIQDCQASEIAALESRIDAAIAGSADVAASRAEQEKWQTALPQLCLEESGPYLWGGSADGLILANCHLQHLAERLFQLEAKIPADK
jgi:hypothetical protein